MSLGSFSLAAALAFSLAAAPDGRGGTGAVDRASGVPGSPATGARPLAEDQAEGAAEKPAARRPHRKSPCERLDAASTPSCADRLPPAPLPAPKAAAPAPRAPPSTPKPNATKTGFPGRASAVRAGRPRGAKHVASSGRRQPAGAWQTAVEAVHRRPILAGGAGGAAVLLLAAGAWSTAGRLRRRPRVGNAARATPPTAFRRDVVLKDEAGRDWRSPGAALTPGVVAGSGPGSQLRLTGEGVAPRHLMFWVCDGRLLARRLAEPVFLNDRLLKDATPEIVSTGDRLRLGRADFTIMID